MSEDIGRVGLGGGTFVAQGYGHVNEDDARATIDAAYEAGIRFFDTAHFYGSGRSEELIGEVLADRRSQITLCTKGGVRYEDPTDLRTLVRDCSYPALRRSAEKSLERLRADEVDFYLLHQFDDRLSPEHQMENLARLQDEGLARRVGFCNFGADECRRALATGIPSVVEYSFSLLDLRYVSELEEARALGCTRISFGTFVHGLLSEDLSEDHEFDAEDWRGRSRRHGSSGTSGNVFFTEGAFERNVSVARRLREVADDHGISLAAFVLALTVRRPETDVVLVGCRNPRELEDGLTGLALDFDPAAVEAADAILASAERPSKNLLGVAR